MPEHVDGVDVILRVQNLRAFQAGMHAAARSVREVGAAGTATSGQLAASSAAATKMTGVLGLVNKAGRAAGAGLAFMAYESAKMSIKFDQQMALIETQAGAPAGEIAKLRDQVLDLAGPGIAQGPEELAKGLFHLESVGLRDTEAMDALKIAAQGASVGLADLEEMTTALGAAWLVDIKGGKSLEEVMAVLNATVGAGNVRMGELVHALGVGLLPTMKNAGLNIVDVMGAMALFTDEGYQASSAAAQFATSIHFLTAPTEKAKKALAEMGLSGTDLALQMHKPQGLLRALTMLQDALHKTGAAGAEFQFGVDEQGMPTIEAMNEAAVREEQLINSILPGGRGRILIVLLNQLERYRMKMEQIRGTAARFDQSVAQTQETSAFKLADAWSDVQAKLVRVGETIDGPLVGALVILASQLEPILYILVGLATWFAATRLAMLGVWSAGRLIAAAKFIQYWYALAKAEGAAATAMFALNLALDTNPIVLITLGIIALIIIIVLLVRHWKEVKKWAVDAFHWVLRAASNTWNWIKRHWPLLLTILLGPIGFAIQWIIRHWGDIKNAFSDAFNFIAKKAKWVGNKIAAPFKWLYDKILRPVVNRIKWIFDHANDAADFVTPGGGGGIWGSGIGPDWDFPFAASGAMVTGGGGVIVGERGPELVSFPTGAAIQPLDRAKLVDAAGGGKDIQVHSHIYLDRRKIAEAVGKHVSDRRARQ